MSAGFSTRLRNARAQAIADDIDTGNDPGTVLFYTGPRPETGAAITTETLVAECELSSPPGTVSNGVLLLDVISDDLSANANADIGWGRIVDGNGDFVMDLDCGIADSGADIIFNTVTARIGGSVRIISGAFVEGNA